MTNFGWTRSESPFHEGELALQARAGAQARIDTQGRHMIREYLIAPYRHFLARLSYVIIGSIDEAASPWASILTGQPEFLSTPDERTLRVAAQPLVGDPLSAGLVVGNDIGVMGIELHTRRRIRINGTVNNLSSDGFEVRVGQSFGNCPQYIQAREVIAVEPDLTTHHLAKPQPVREVVALSAPEKDMITTADTFFVATAYQAKSAGAASGVDISHRGGKPGFVKIEENDTLTIPDFSGNYHFNTLGNLLLNPRAGLLFIDFEKGDLLYLTGTTEIIWEGDEIANYEGAQRLLRFQLTRGYRVEGSLLLHWSAPEFSPLLNSKRFPAID